MNHKGYWNGLHTKIQLEDVCDCLSVVFLQLDYTFLFDQSSGHIKMRKGVISINNMNISYCVAVTEMRASGIQELDSHIATLMIGEEQSMLFKPTNTGTFWTTEGMRVTTKMDMVTSEIKHHEKNKVELLVDLQKTEVGTTKRRF